MRSRSNVSHVAAVLASFVLSSCGSTQLSREWRDPSYRLFPETLPGSDPRGILVPNLYGETYYCAAG